MNNNEENNFKEYAKESTPDLWDKIEEGLPNGMYTKDSSNEDNTTSDNTKDKKTNKVIKFPTRKIYTIAGIVAACLVILAIPLFTNSNNDTKKSINFSASDSLDSNKSIVSSEEKSQNNDDTNAYSAYDGIDKNSTDNVTNNITSENEPENNKNDNTKLQEGTTMNPTITLKVTKHHTTDIGLVYEGVIIDTTSKTIKKDDTVYVTLRKLTRHDLLHTYEPNEEFTISLYDDTFTSSPSSPYYALKKIK